MVLSNMFPLNWSHPASPLHGSAALLARHPLPRISHATPVDKFLLKPPRRLFAEVIFLPNELGCDGGIAIYAPGASALKMKLFSLRYVVFPPPVYNDNFG